MLVLNYSHPLTPAQREQIEALTHKSITEVRAVPTHLDLTTPFGEHAVALADAANLSPTDWQTEPLLVVPPALNFAAVALLAELHGRAGYFPPIVRLRPVPDALPPQYEVAEIINLQALRDAARKRRRISNFQI